MSSERRLRNLIQETPIVNCWIVLTKDFTGEIILSEEHQNYDWVSAEEFIEMDWHRDADYAIPAMKSLDRYLEEE